MANNIRFTPFIRLALALSALGSAFPVLSVPEMPATMVLVGEIAPQGLLGVRPRAGDTVLGFLATDGQLVGSGQLEASGSYLLVMTRYASFNGMPLVIELQQGRMRYALLRATDSTPAMLRFAGRTLPERTLLNLRIGAKTAELTAAEAASPQAQRLTQRADLPCDTLADVNEDGRCDAADWAILRRYAGGVTRTVAEP